jgi:hypothetical protein
MNDSGQPVIDAFMNIARLCAEANAGLTIAQKSETHSGAALWSHGI